MQNCDFNTECFFLNVKTAALPLTTGLARTKYCNGDFTTCTIYKSAKIHGIDMVPRYVSPEDKYVLHHRIVENAPLGMMCR